MGRQPRFMPAQVRRYMREFIAAQLRLPPQTSEISSARFAQGTYCHGSA